MPTALPVRVVWPQSHATRCVCTAANNPWLNEVMGLLAACHVRFFLFLVLFKPRTSSLHYRPPSVHLLCTFARYEDITEPDALAEAIQGGTIYIYPYAYTPHASWCPWDHCCSHAWRVLAVLPSRVALATRLLDRLC